MQTLIEYFTKENVKPIYVLPFVALGMILAAGVSITPYLLGINQNHSCQC